MSFSSWSRWLSWCVILGIFASGGCQGESAPGESVPSSALLSQEGSPSTTPDEQEPSSGANSAQQTPPTQSKHPSKQPQRTKRTNRLARETSPYLLQHADNPVDWYPWGEEALAKARRENKLIFLSIGYSSCHWCHVMEQETFSDPEVAEFLNQHFVSIKVDREERPDVDEVYMTALVMYYRFTGQPSGGGWPLSMFLTPQGLPIAGGTYFPPRPKRGLPGFLDVARRIQQAWSRNPQRVRRAAEALAAAVRRALRPVPSLGVHLSPGPIANLMHTLQEDFDPQYGGFGYHPAQPQQPKFPQPPQLYLLLHRAFVHQDPQARKMLLKTLDALAAGGIRDHLGGGFHRYSTDRYWLVPHFEKMLYDNAQLLHLYALAWQHTSQPVHRRVAEQTAEFLFRELQAPQGAFYSSLDAQSEGQEGRYYIWSPEELQPLEKLPGWNLVRELYGLQGQPNFEGHWVLHWAVSPEQLAQKHNLTLEQLWQAVDPVREHMHRLRQRRPRPRRDIKILAAWNGLAITALAEGGLALQKPAWIRQARRAAQFIWQHMRNEQGRLYRTWTSGKARLPGYLIDYAAVVRGFLALHQATGEELWLQRAQELWKVQQELFADSQGAFYYTSSEHEELFVRMRGPADGPIPSGNSLTAENLLLLAQRTQNAQYRHRAENLLRAFGKELENLPEGYPYMVLVLDRLLDAQPRLPLVAPEPVRKASSASASKQGTSQP